MFEYQAPATLNQAGPVQNTWYTILDTTAYVRVYDASINIEDTDETLEIQFTVDGQTMPATPVACTHSTKYECYLETEPITRVARINLVAGAPARRKPSFIIEGHSVKIEVRKTTAAGAGNLTGIISYGILKPIG